MKDYLWPIVTIVMMAALVAIKLLYPTLGTAVEEMYPGITPVLDTLGMVVWLISVVAFLVVIYYVARLLFLH